MGVYVVVDKEVSICAFYRIARPNLSGFDVFAYTGALNEFETARFVGIVGVG